MHLRVLGHLFRSEMNREDALRVRFLYYVGHALSQRPALPFLRIGELFEQLSRLTDRISMTKVPNRGFSSTLLPFFVRDLALWRRSPAYSRKRGPFDSRAFLWKACQVTRCMLHWRFIGGRQTSERAGGPAGSMELEIRSH